MNRIARLMILVGLTFSCGEAIDVEPLTSRLSREDVPYCEVGHSAVTTSACGVEYMGVGCYVCGAPVGQPAIAACAWDDQTWCVASCDKCPTPEDIAALVATSP